MNKLLYLLFIVLCWGCQSNSQTEKYLNKPDNVINVKENVREIQIEDVEIGSISPMFLINDYLIIGDVKSSDRLIHLFDKDGFEYITSIAERGQGPGEIANIGHIGINESDRMFYVSDHGKQKIFSFDLDSVLTDPFYLPEEKMNMEESQFPDRYQYISDTLCIGIIVQFIGDFDFSQSIAKWNMNTGEIKSINYEHPDVEKKRVCFAASVEHEIYVECHLRYDLMTICDFNGDLIYNIYGGNWNKKTNRNHYYRNVAFCNDKILALYSGENAFIEDRGPKVNSPTKFLVFDIGGNYLQTIEIGYQVTYFCYDKGNNRIIMSLDDEIQFAYLDLDGIID